MLVARILPLLLLAACGLTPQQKDTDSGSGDSDDTGGGGGSTTIVDIRAGGAGDGDSVTLEGVIVTSPLTRKGDGFFIQDAAGGPRSGLYVWSQAGFSAAPAQIGDVVSISGTISEYYDWTELVISDPASVTVTSTGSVPTAIDLGDGAGVNWDDYESVLVSLADQTIESIDEFNTGMLTAGIELDDGFQYNDYTCRDHYDTVTGVVFYSYEAWSVNNRTDDDLVGYAAGEPIDATVAEVQQGGICGSVNLKDVVVTSPVFGDSGEGTFFVQDAGGGPYSGIAIYAKDFAPTVDIGETITVSGAPSEYYDFTELVVNGSENLVSTGTMDPVSTELSAVPEDWEPYESCLVTLLDVEATSDEDYGQFTTNYEIFVDDLFFDFSASNGDTWAEITGPLYYTSFDNVPEWKVEPRQAQDLVE